MNREEKHISFNGNKLSYDAWAAIDTINSVLSKSIIVQLIGNSVYELEAPKKERSDVADYFKNPQLKFAGFGGNFSAIDVPTGFYELRVLMENNEGNWIQCPFNRPLVERTAG